MSNEQERLVAASISEWMEQEAGCEAVLDSEQTGEMRTYLLDNYDALQAAARDWLAARAQESEDA